MRRRTFLSALPAGALAAAAAQAQTSGETQSPTAAAPAPARPAAPYAGIGIGDRITGPKFMGRSTVWGANGAAATAHPVASLVGWAPPRSRGRYQPRSALLPPRLRARCWCRVHPA